MKKILSGYIQNLSLVHLLDYKIKPPVYFGSLAVCSEELILDDRFKFLVQRCSCLYTSKQVRKLYNLETGLFTGKIYIGGEDTRCTFSYPCWATSVSLLDVNNVEFDMLPSLTTITYRGNVNYEYISICKIIEKRELQIRVHSHVFGDYWNHD